MKVPYNMENCEELATYIVGGMDLDTLYNMCRDMLIERYSDKQFGQENFYEDVENSGFLQDEDED